LGGGENDKPKDHAWKKLTEKAWKILANGQNRPCHKNSNTDDVKGNNQNIILRSFATDSSENR